MDFILGVCRAKTIFLDLDTQITIFLFNDLFLYNFTQTKRMRDKIDYKNDKKKFYHFRPHSFCVYVSHLFDLEEKILTYLNQFTVIVSIYFLISLYFFNVYK